MFHMCLIIFLCDKICLLNIHIIIKPCSNLSSGYIWKNGCCHEVCPDSLRTQLGINATIDTRCKKNPNNCSRDLCEKLCKKLQKSSAIIACEHIKYSDWSIGNDCVAVHGCVPEVKRPPRDSRITECRCAILGRYDFFEFVKTEKR